MTVFSVQEKRADTTERKTRNEGSYSLKGRELGCFEQPNPVITRSPGGFLHLVELSSGQRQPVIRYTWAHAGLGKETRSAAGLGNPTCKWSHATDTTYSFQQEYRLEPEGHTLSDLRTLEPE